MVDTIINSKKGIDTNWVTTVEPTFPNFRTSKGRTKEAIPIDKEPAEKINPIWADVADNSWEKYTLKYGTIMPAPNPIMILHPVNFVTNPRLPENNGCDSVTVFAIFSSFINIKGKNASNVNPPAVNKVYWYCCARTGMVKAKNAGKNPPIMLPKVLEKLRNAAVTLNKCILS